MTPTPTTDAASRATSQCLPPQEPLPSRTKQRIAYVHGIRKGTKEAERSGLTFGSADVYVVSKRAVVEVMRHGIYAAEPTALKAQCETLVSALEAEHRGDPFFRFHYRREYIVRNLISGEGIVVGDGSRTKAH